MATQRSMCRAKTESSKKGIFLSKSRATQKTSLSMINRSRPRKLMLGRLLQLRLIVACGLLSTSFFTYMTNWNYPQDILSIGDALRAAQIPPPGYPWHVFGLHKLDLIGNPKNIDDASQERYYGLISNLESKVRDELRKGDDPEAVQAKTSRDPHLYFIEHGKLLAMRSQQEHIRNVENPTHFMVRQRPFEDMAQSALNVAKLLLLKEQGSTNVSAFHPRLRELLDQNVSIPLLFNIRDLGQVDCRLPKSSPSRNNRSTPLPMMGWSVELPGAPVKNQGRDCHIMTFAVPGYEPWEKLRLTSKFMPTDWDRNSACKSRRKRRRIMKILRGSAPELWDISMDNMQSRYPWSKKISKAVWRGATTGAGYSHWKQQPRSKLVNRSFAYPDLMDVGFSTIVQKWNTPEYISEIRREMFEKDPIPFADFMKYKAIIDIDGNSWSSRFGNLLCMNSVVVKIAPNTTDYWYDELQPWVHYIPVKQDLSDLLIRLRFVFDPVNDSQMQDIVRTANEWCQQKMTLTQLAVDMLWIILTYLDVLDNAVQSSSPTSSLTSWLEQWNNVTALHDFMEVAPQAIFSSLDDKPSWDQELEGRRTCLNP